VPRMTLCTKSTYLYELHERGRVSNQGKRQFHLS
jgi:hypothetical protein